MMAWIGGSINVEASETSMILLESYSVTDEQIVPGENFTMTMEFKNYGMESVTGVLVDIACPDGIMPVYGTVAQVYIDEIIAGETKEIGVEFVANKVMNSTSVDFSVTIIHDGNPLNYVSVRVPVGTDVPFFVLSDKMPTTVVAGENVTSSISFEVIGHTDVKTATHVVSVGDEQIGSSTIGSLTVGTTRTQNTSVVFKEPGEYQVDVAIQYIDETDQPQSFVVGTKTITVKEKKDTDSQEYAPVDETSMQEDDKGLILGLASMVLVAILLVAVIIKKSK